jgi:RHS repeat-associated protein
MGGGTETLTYDGDGKRVQKILPGGTTNYVYDAFGRLAAEYSNIPAYSPCTTCYLSSDYLGSLRMVTDSSGAVISRHDYLPFGEEISPNSAGRTSQWGPGNDNVSQKFTGQTRDEETKLDYFNARYFGAALGRFTSPDPGGAGADIANPQTWNAYAYVLDNPLANTDPRGIASKTDTVLPSSSCSGPAVSYDPFCVNGPWNHGTDMLGIDAFDPFGFIGSGLTDEQNGTLNFGSFAAAAGLGSASIGGSSGNLSAPATPQPPSPPASGPTPALPSAPTAPRVPPPVAPPTNNNPSTKADEPLNPYAQAVFTDPRLQTTARVMTSPCTYIAWTGAAAIAGSAGAAVANGSEIVSAVSDNSATLIHKVLTWWFNFTGRPSSGAWKATTLAAPAAAGAVANVCNSF